MKHCLCCGLPSPASICLDCGEVFFLPWRHLEVSRAWTSVALTASRAEQAQRERVFQP